MKTIRLVIFVALCLPFAGCGKFWSNSLSGSSSAPTGGGSGGSSSSVSTNTNSGTQTSPSNSDTASNSSSATQGWVSYSPRDNSYSVRFPGQPEEKAQTANTALGTINYVMATYSSNLGHRAYISSAIHYNVEPQNYNVEKGLDGARDGAAKNSGATILSEKRIDSGGVPGRELVMKTSSAHMKMRLFIANRSNGPTLYQALIVDTDGEVNFPEADAFFNSLSFPGL